MPGLRPQARIAHYERRGFHASNLGMKVRSQAARVASPTSQLKYWHAFRASLLAAPHGGYERLTLRSCAELTAPNAMPLPKEKHTETNWQCTRKQPTGEPGKTRQRKSTTKCVKNENPRKPQTSPTTKKKRNASCTIRKLAIH